jgi:hypothetical protein
MLPIVRANQGRGETRPRASAWMVRYMKRFHECRAPKLAWAAWTGSVVSHSGVRLIAGMCLTVSPDSACFKRPSMVGRGAGGRGRSFLLRRSRWMVSIAPQDAGLLLRGYESPGMRHRPRQAAAPCISQWWSICEVVVTPRPQVRCGTHGRCRRSDRGRRWPTSTRRLTRAANPPTLRITSTCPRCSPRLIGLANTDNPSASGEIGGLTSAHPGGL